MPKSPDVLLTGHTEMDLPTNLLPLQGSAAGFSPSSVICQAVPTASVQIQDRGGVSVCKYCVTEACFHEFIAVPHEEQIQQLDNC